MISSPSNPRIKHLVRLRTRRARDADGVTLVEGHAELGRARDAGVRIRAVFHDPGVVDASRFPTALEVVAVSPAALAKVAMRSSTEGFVAVVDRPGTALADLVPGARPLVLVVEAVEKPGNLGAMLRTADAAGVGAVLIADPTTDLANPNVVRASLGCVFTVPAAVAPAGDVISWMRGHSIRLCATTPAGEVGLFDADLTGPLAIAIGAEHAGLGAELLAAADLKIRIPMAGTADSLNASVAAGIALFEAVRQRRA